MYESMPKAATGRPATRMPLKVKASRDDRKARQTMENRKEKRPKGRMPKR